MLMHLQGHFSYRYPGEPTQRPASEQPHQDLPSSAPQLARYGDALSLVASLSANRRGGVGLRVLPLPRVTTPTSDWKSARDAERPREDERATMLAFTDLSPLNEMAINRSRVKLWRSPLGIAVR